MQTQIKQAIRQLPIQQRAVAIALKNIFDQVKDLTRKQQQQIDANHLGFIGRFKQLQQRASTIIQGTKQLTINDLDTSTQFFTEQQLPQRANLLKNKLPIEQYWYRAIANSQHGDNLTQQQTAILKSITDIQTSITTNQISLTIIIKANIYVNQGQYIRTLVLDNGMPVKFTGSQPQWISKQIKMDGVIMGLLLTNSDDQDKLASVFGLVGGLVNQIVPYSLEYYLGALGDDQQQGQQGGDDEDEEEDDNEDGDEDEQ